MNVISDSISSTVRISIDLVAPQPTGEGVSGGFYFDIFEGVSHHTILLEFGRFSSSEDALNASLEPFRLPTTKQGSRMSNVCGQAVRLVDGYWPALIVPIRVSDVEYRAVYVSQTSDGDGAVGLVDFVQTLRNGERPLLSCDNWNGLTAQLRDCVQAAAESKDGGLQGASVGTVVTPSPIAISAENAMKPELGKDIDEPNELYFWPGSSIDLIFDGLKREASESLSERLQARLIHISVYGLDTNGLSDVAIDEILFVDVHSVERTDTGVSVTLGIEDGYMSLNARSSILSIIGQELDVLGIDSAIVRDSVN